MNVRVCVCVCVCMFVCVCVCVCVYFQGNFGVKEEYMGPLLDSLSTDSMHDSIRMVSCPLGPLPH